MSTSPFIKYLSYASTVLLLTSLVSLIYFASDLQRFEKRCKKQMSLFQSFEQAAWKDIIKLGEVNLRRKRQIWEGLHREFSIPKLRKTRKSKLRKVKKPKVVLQKQLVPVAEKLTEIDEYRNSDWNKDENESENEIENQNTTAGDDTEEPDDPGIDTEDTYSAEKEEEKENNHNSKEAEGEDTTEEIGEQVRNMTTREMKMEYGMAEGGLAQLLEIDNDGEEKEEEEEEEEGEEGDEDVEGQGSSGEYVGEQVDEEDCADTDLKCYGNPCPRGPPGPPGLPGTPGEDAPDGEDGGNGTEWELHSEDRVIVLGCVKCPPGPRGIEGDPGPPGDKGGIGKNGNPGLDGYEGFPGQTGSEGEAGYDGDYGPDGWPGQRGEDAKIYRNLPGPPGPPGVAGPPGENGDYGNLGNGGTEGIAGVAGSPGHHGIPGPPGAPGAPGEPGISAELVGQCKCPERRTPGGGGGGYPIPPPSYYPAPPPPPYQLPYPTSTEVYYLAPTSPEYVESTTEAPTTSIYRYFVKASAPGYKTTSSEKEYVEPTTKTAKYSEYSVEKESPYVESYQQEASNHLAESEFEPPEDHSSISRSEK